MSRDYENEQDLIALLHGRGQRVTPQRLGILRELRALGGHVTAERVHRALAVEQPGTSIPTVYATLDLLVELGLARRLDVGRGVALYDARVDPHEHAVCRGCGAIVDLDARFDAGALLEAASDSGFAAERTQALVFGVCAGCAGAAAG